MYCTNKSIICVKISTFKFMILYIKPLITSNCKNIFADKFNFQLVFFPEGIEICTQMSLITNLVINAIKI
jgi:hypothetical protein